MRTEWKLSEWNGLFCDHDAPKLTREEIRENREWLRKNNYPIPSDCPREDCMKYRPSCNLNVCHVAVGMCGDLAVGRTRMSHHRRRRPGFGA